MNDRMQSDYVYYLTEPEGIGFDSRFSPELTPGEMLELGVFGGKYMTDCVDEFPEHWFKDAKFSSHGYNKDLNFFGVKASQPLKVWDEKGWLWKDDPRGWFQWYCRYYRGRRCEDDERQISRWSAMRRHLTQILKNCERGDIDCRPRQRQALLHWAYDSREI